MPYLDELDESAKYVGCVNTVKRAGDKLIGYNTDIDGMAYLFSRAGVSLTDKTVVVLGSGGTSKTARALATARARKRFISSAARANIITRISADSRMRKSL